MPLSNSYLPQNSELMYLEIKIQAPLEFIDLLTAELVNIDFDSFMETPEGFNAYVEESLFKEDDFKEILTRYLSSSQYSYSFERMENKNWNEEWEKNFRPVTIEDQCIVKASFHKIDEHYPYEIIINPKMSFGTGHHETTHMMIRNQLKVDHINKKVVDAGSGTGILAIMAEKLGAKEIMAYDIEDWSFENLKENVNLNGCSRINVAQGTVHTVNFPSSSYDIVLANINKNVLLEEIPFYSKLLTQKGILIISGFYMNDVADIENVYIHSSLRKVDQEEKNNWSSLVLEKY
jgi:ribosomal protein L11 methyltransferase